MGPIELLATLGLPALFWIGYLYYRDRRQPEPLWTKGLAFALGVGAGFGALWLYDVTDLLWSPPLPEEALGDAEFLLYCVVVIGGVEELAKLVPFLLVCARLPQFDEEIDGIVYASAIGLGFATLENFYFLPELPAELRYARGFASPLVHTVFSSIWGWAYARADMHRRNRCVATVIAFAIAMVAHGIYDYLAMSVLLGPLSALVAGGVWIWRIRLMTRLHREGAETNCGG